MFLPTRCSLICTKWARRKRPPLPASAAERDRYFRAGESRLRIHRRLGIVAARTLGSGHRAGSGLHLAVQCSFRHGRRRLHPVGSAAGAVASRNTTPWSPPAPHRCALSHLKPAIFSEADRTVSTVSVVRRRFDKLEQSQPEADVAQLVEQPIRNRQVSGSSPLVGSIQKHARNIVLSPGPSIAIAAAWPWSARSH